MQTVVVGISGGVDSSVAALLLKQQGYNVIGVFMKNWEEQNENGVCCSDADSADAKAVCDKLGIAFHQVNYSKNYYDKVFKEFLKDYNDGLTPNPDVLCNKEIKFGPLLDFALKIGADYLATGHYAKLEKSGKIFQLKKCADSDKDQTYFLNQLNQKQLSKTLFPLADLKKPQVRKIAVENNLITASKKDSTGICFIGERNFKTFLKNYIHAKPGNLVLENGKIVGRHDGLCYYTMGQSKGLGIGGIKGFKDEKFCVVDKNLETNEIVIGTESSGKLYSEGLIAKSFNFTGKKYAEGDKINCTAKFRYRQEEQKVAAMFYKDHVKIEFEESQRAITKGQFVVLYLGEDCIGGGKITDVINLKERKC